MSAAGQFAPSWNLRWLSPPDSRARLRPRSVRGFSEVPIAAAKSSALLAAGPSGIEGEAQAVWPQGEERSGSPSVVCFPELWDLHPGLLQQASCVRSLEGKPLCACVPPSQWSVVGFSTPQTGHVGARKHFQI